MREPKLPGMRDLDVIESELRLLAAVRRTAAELGAPAPRIGPADELLDEWIERRTVAPRIGPLVGFGVTTIRSGSASTSTPSPQTGTT